jgi:hypothetical protein
MEIQILLAFVIQSLIAVFVSAYTFLLSFVIQRRWDAAATEPEAWTFFVQDNAPAWLRMLKNPRSAIDLLTFKLLRLSFWWMPSLNLQNANGKYPSSTLVWLIGKQPEEPRQRTIESNIEDEITPTTRRLEFANRILLAGSDVQSFTGTKISLLLNT